jgi:hypothetical protein
MSRRITCHCGAGFELPADLTERRTNCPTCGSVFFLAASDIEGVADEEAGGYDLSPGDDRAAGGGTSIPRKSEGIPGTPEWLKRYREQKQAEKGPPDKALVLLGRLGSDSSGLDSMGGVLFKAVTRSDAETSVPALVQVALSGHPVYAAVARSCLDYLGPPESAGGAGVLTMLQAAHEPAQHALLVECLKQLGPTSTVPVRQLVDLLNGPHTELYLWGIRCLERVGSPARSAVGALIKSLRAENDELRLAVIDALGAIGREPARVLPLLFQALRNKNPAYRRHAAQALGRFGADAATAIAPLRTALNDADPSVQQAATEALGRIVDACGKRATQSGGGGPAPTTIPKPILVDCPCGKRLKIKPELTGMKGKCPACGGTINIPVPVVDTGASDEKSCPACLASVAADDVLCVHCGHDFRTTAQRTAEPAGG